LASPQLLLVTLLLKRSASTRRDLGYVESDK
jgi:hypothetical protein